MHLKHIPMDGPQNLRDLGGFLNGAGKAVAWNKLYRADGLSNLSQKDLETFQKLNIRTIVDLRSLAEQEAMPDRIPEGVTYCACPMMGESSAASAQAAAISFAQSLKIGYLAMIQENGDKVGAAVKTVIEGLSRGAVVFHCTAGKDRTGVLAAILLLLLGVSQEDIIADYQVSFTYNARGVNRMILQIPELKDCVEQAGEDSTLHSNPKNIQAVLSVLNTENIAQWLAAAGVSEALQQCFRDTMLEDEAL